MQHNTENDKVNSLQNKIRNNKRLVIFWIILLIGATLRFYGLENAPAGVYRDEAYAGYEAYSILNERTDSWGYKNSVYFGKCKNHR